MHSLLVLVYSGWREKEIAVLLWDDVGKELVLEITLDAPVLALRINHSKLVVSLPNTIHVFSFGLKGTHTVQLFHVSGYTRVSGVEDGIEVL